MRESLCVLMTVVWLAGCDDKSKAEKHAEDMAAEKASASAAAKASASAVDPKEAKFAAARKALKDRVTAYMGALTHLYEGATDADKSAFHAYFPASKDGEKAADDIFKEATVAAKNTKMTIKKWDLQELSLDSEMTGGTTDIYVEESQNGKPRCTTYKLEWKDDGGIWRRTAQKDFRIVSCS